MAVNSEHEMKGLIVQPRQTLPCLPPGSATVTNGNMTARQA
jgi:hypothetical protein